MRWIPTPRARAGVTIIDLILTIALISVLAAAVPQTLAPAFKEFKVVQTLAQLRRIRDALLGDPDKVMNGVRTDFGYLGDLGALPTVAQGGISALLTAPAGVTSYTMDSAVRFKRGWSGPYLPTLPGVDWTRDAWGRSLSYRPTLIPPRLGSLGADGLAGGTGYDADLVVEIPGEQRTFTLLGALNDSTGAAYTSSAQAELNDLSGTGAVTTTLATADGSGRFTFSNVTRGRRSVTIYTPTRAAPTATYGPFIVVPGQSNQLAALTIPATSSTPCPTGEPLRFYSVANTHAYLSTTTSANDTALITQNGEAPDYLGSDSRSLRTVISNIDGLGASNVYFEAILLGRNTSSDDPLFIPVVAESGVAGLLVGFLTRAFNFGATGVLGDSPPFTETSGYGLNPTSIVTLDGAQTDYGVLDDAVDGTRLFVAIDASGRVWMTATKTGATPTWPAGGDPATATGEGWTQPGNIAYFGFSDNSANNIVGLQLIQEADKSATVPAGFCYAVGKASTARGWGKFLTNSQDRTFLHNSIYTSDTAVITRNGSQAVYDGADNGSSRFAADLTGIGVTPLYWEFELFSKNRTTGDYSSSLSSVRAGVANSIFSGASVLGSANSWAIQLAGTTTSKITNGTATTVLSGAGTALESGQRMAIAVDSSLRLWVGRFVSGALTWYTSTLGGAAADPATAANPLYTMTGADLRFWVDDADTNALVSARMVPPDDAIGPIPSGFSYPPAPPGGDHTKVTVFEHTGAEQSYTVPSGVTSITVHAWGGGGGGGGGGSITAGAFGTGAAGGAGGYVTDAIAVTASEVLTIRVGGGGGGGGVLSVGSERAGGGGGGGGYSAVLRSGTALLVAGGGGGGGGGDNSNSVPGPGGAGGGTTGVAGTAGASANTQGQGGTQVAGGTAGTSAQNTGGASPSNGTAWAGGAGGSDAAGGSTAASGGTFGGASGGRASNQGGDPRSGGGGGGGGRFGGGGANAANATSGGGANRVAAGAGGGSSLTPSGAGSTTAGSGVAPGSKDNTFRSSPVGGGGAGGTRGAASTPGTAGQHGRVVVITN